MRLVNLAAIDQLLPRDRLAALGALGDGIDQYPGEDFAIAIGDKLYDVKNAQDEIKPAFSMLLSLELGTIDGALIELPQDPEIWRLAVLEYDSFVSKQEMRTQLTDKDPVGDFKRLRELVGETHVFVMLGRAGVAAIIDDECRWMLSYRSFASLIEPKLTAPDLLDFDLERYTEEEVSAIMGAHEDHLGAPYHSDSGLGNYIALLAIERGRTLTLSTENPTTEVYRSGRILTPRR
jgi:hypothetical protein